MLIPVDVGKEYSTQFAFGANVGKEALCFSNALFAIEMAESNASKPSRSVDDFTREVTIVSQSAQECTCSFVLYVM